MIRQFAAPSFGELNVTSTFPLDSATALGLELAVAGQVVSPHFMGSPWPGKFAYSSGCVPWISQSDTPLVPVELNVTTTLPLGSATALGLAFSATGQLGFAQHAPAPVVGTKQSTKPDELPNAVMTSPSERVTEPVPAPDSGETSE